MESDKYKEYEKARIFIMNLVVWLKIILQILILTGILNVVYAHMRKWMKKLSGIYTGYNLHINNESYIKKFFPKPCKN